MRVRRKRSKKNLKRYIQKHDFFFLCGKKSFRCILHQVYEVCNTSAVEFCGLFMLILSQSKFTMLLHVLQYIAVISCFSGKHAADSFGRLSLEDTEYFLPGHLLLMQIYKRHHRTQQFEYYSKLQRSEALSMLNIAVFNLMVRHQLTANKINTSTSYPVHC